MDEERIDEHVVVFGCLAIGFSAALLVESVVLGIWQHSLEPLIPRLLIAIGAFVIASPLFL
jgi:hypothetical protein